ncbi:MAG: hypothetical protein JW395_2864 [Nitrospira sp.]|nr:hypothetical protein [Nitrospira sp.]
MIYERLILMRDLMHSDGSISSNQSGEGKMHFFKNTFLSLVKSASSALSKLVARLRLAWSQFITLKPPTMLS